MIVLLGLVLPAHAASPQALQAGMPTDINAAYEAPHEKLSAMQMAAPIAPIPSGEVGQAAQGEQDGEACPGHPNIHRKSAACPAAGASGDAPEEAAVDPPAEEACPGHPHIHRKSKACPTAAYDPPSDEHAPPEENPPSNDGEDCFKACDKKAGSCDDFCGHPGLWSGMCCKRGATGNQSAPECLNKGCSGFHCCVSVPWDDEAHVGTEKGIIVDEPSTDLKPAAKDKYVKPEWSAQDLAGIFQRGKPSNDLRQAGLLVHGFDGTELDDTHRWMPCTEGFCKGAAKWWSTSLINHAHPATWGANGLVLSPSRSKVLCSHYCDFGSLNAGCATSAPDGFNNTGKPYPPTYLKDMLQRSMYEAGAMGAYNEVLVDMPEFAANLPHSVAAFYYKAGADGFKQVEAAHAYVAFLDAFNLTEGSVPLLKFNMNASGQMDGDAPQVRDVAQSAMMEDVSMGARALLAKHKYAGWSDKWRANHPYIEAHPDEAPSWLRKQAARNWGKPARGKELIDGGLPVVATSEAALDARAGEQEAAAEALTNARANGFESAAAEAKAAAEEAAAAAAEVKEGDLPQMHEQYKRAFNALLDASKAKAAATSAATSATSAVTSRKEAFANAAALVQSRTKADKDTKVLPSLPAAKPGAHGAKALDPVQAKLDAAVLNAEALSALKEREVQLVSANEKISAADELHLSMARDSKASADASFLSQMQAEVSSRAATKAQTDATGAALAETIAGVRANEKLSDDAKAQTMASRMTKARADAKTKSDEMAVAANSVIRETRFGSKTSDDAASAAEAEKLVSAKAVAMVVADAKAEAEAQAVRLEREHSKATRDATSAASAITGERTKSGGGAKFVPAAHVPAHKWSNSKAAALVQGATTTTTASANPARPLSPWQQRRLLRESGGGPGAASKAGPGQYHAGGSGAGGAQTPAQYKSAYDALAGVKHNPYVQAPKHQMRHRADKEAHEMAMLAASTLSCTSLSKSVTQAWCVSSCDNVLHSCPSNVCRCEKKAGFGGDTALPAAAAAPAAADAIAAPPAEALSR